MHETVAFNYFDISIGNLLLYKSDLPAVMGNVANAISNQIRSGGETGDNNNATIVNGAAVFNEVYIRVRWAWLILPVSEMLLAAVLLVAVIVVTRGGPMVKESVVACVMYGMDDPEREAVRSRRPVTRGEMDEAAKRLDVRLLKTGDGQMRFVRE